MDELVAVQVSVPRQRLGDFYRMFGTWFEKTGADVELVSNGTSTSGDDDPHSRRGEAWKSGDQAELLRDAICLYTNISALSKRIIDYWLDHDVRRHKADDMVRELGLDSTRAIAGSLSSLTRSGQGCGDRGLPFHWKEEKEGTLYWMDKETRDLFIQAREHSGR